MTRIDDALAALARTELAQVHLRGMLRGVKPAVLNRRPPSGAWSPMEHVRHLLFAQQHHFRAHLPKGFRWRSAGVPPPNRTGERRLSPVGSEAEASIDDVFDAWAKVNDVVRGICNDPDDKLVWRLERNLTHVRLHTNEIERLLRG